MAEQRTIISKVKDLRVTVNNQERVIAKLQKKIENDGTLVPVNSSTHDDLLSLMKVHNGSVLSSYPENSFQAVFWKSQFHAMQQKSSTRIRWHPIMINFHQVFHSQY